MSTTPCWNILTWESDPFGIRQGTVRWSTPRGDLGFPIYFDVDPRGFHFGQRLEFRHEAARQQFHRALLSDFFKRFPRARVSGDQR